MNCTVCGSEELQKNGGGRLFCKSCKTFHGIRVSRQIRGEESPTRGTLLTTVESVNKKRGSFNWREVSQVLKSRKELHDKAGWSQDQAKIIITTELPYIIFQPLSDVHIGAMGVDYDSLVEITDGIINNPYIYTALIGDLTDNFGSFKNQLPVLSQILSPDEQDEFAESWLRDIKPKMLFAGWGNHEAFSETGNGKNEIKKLLSRGMVYFNGIGIANLEINGINYKIVATHKTRFNSAFNKTHGLKQMARKEIPDADLYVSGHTHDPSIECTSERGLEQIFMVLDSMKKQDGYAKRYFSYWTNSQSNCVVLNTREKQMVAFKSLKEALHYVRYDEETAEE